MFQPRKCWLRKLAAVSSCDGGEVLIERENAVADDAAARDDDGEHAARGEAAEVDVLQQVGGRGGADGDADAAGERGEDVRGAFEQGGGAGDAGEAGVDLRVQASRTSACAWLLARRCR